MKSLVLLSILLLLSYLCLAQQSLLAKRPNQGYYPAQYIAAGNIRQQWIQNEADRYLRIRNTGKVFTFSGIGLMAAGGFLIATSDQSGPFSSWNGQAIAGSVGLIAGALSTTGGIVLWTRGNKKMKQESTSIQVYPRGAAGLVYSF